MEIETLFTEQRWNILSLLSKEKLSPLQMSSVSNTTIANISQQLRLLEAANLVHKEKIKNREKGKPRTIFSLAEDYAYLVTTMNNFADKKLIIADEFKRYILRSFFVKNVEMHYPLIKFYYKIEPFVSDIDCIYISDNTLTIAVDKLEAIKNKINISGINFPEKTSLKIISTKDLGKLKNKETVEILFDPKNHIQNKEIR